MTEEFKQRLKHQIEDLFDRHMTDKTDLDNVGDSVSSGLNDFEQELSPLSEQEMNEFLEFIEECINDCIEEFEQSLDEEE